LVSGPHQFVNPRQKEVFGQRCFRRCATAAAVDHALVIVPAMMCRTSSPTTSHRCEVPVYSAMMGDGDE
jgi:hypothetical protein